MSIKEKEDAMMQAGDKLGLLMSKTSPEQKEILKKIKDDVEKYASEREKEGKYIDRSSMYAVAIILDDNLKAEEELITAAKEFIDADYEYIKCLKNATEA
ncbi:MAG: hypothetical protein LWY06_13855 [Firmicutes bacterium]|nr:hypothetical protein [Bacillota bacterium]